MTTKHPAQKRGELIQPDARDEQAVARIVGMRTSSTIWRTRLSYGTRPLGGSPALPASWG